MQAAVPLWKVIVGAPTPANSTGPQRPGFSLCAQHVRRPDMMTTLFLLDYSTADW
jgi:hypothetical protein